jgi:hypothetical protein
MFIESARTFLPTGHQSRQVAYSHECQTDVGRVTDPTMGPWATVFLVALIRRLQHWFVKPAKM